MAVKRALRARRRPAEIMREKTPAAISRRRAEIIGRHVQNFDEWSTTFAVGEVDALSHNRQSRDEGDTLRAEFGRRLTELREMRFLTQDELGKKLVELGVINTKGRPNTYISRMERGKWDMNLSSLVGLCHALRCSPNDLIPPL